MARKSKHRQQTEAFEVWYACDRDFHETYQKLAENWDKAPSERTLYTWSTQLEWIARANARDDAAEQRAAKDAIKRKAEMLKRHADAGRVLQGKGYEYLKAKGLDSGQQAINAIVKGIEVERTSEGLPAWIVDLLAASDDDLIQQYNQLLTQINGARSGDEAPGDSAAD